MTMSDAERQRLKQLEQATEELAESIENLQDAVETRWIEDDRRWQRNETALFQINETLQILHDQNRAVFRRLTDIEDELSNER